MEDQEYIEELKERDKPAEVIFDDNGWPRCPVCNEMVYDGSFCRFCGQRLKEW